MSKKYAFLLFLEKASKACSVSLIKSNRRIDNKELSGKHPT